MRVFTLGVYTRVTDIFVFMSEGEATQKDRESVATIACIAARQKRNARRQHLCNLAAIFEKQPQTSVHEWNLVGNAFWVLAPWLHNTQNLVGQTLPAQRIPLLQTRFVQCVSG